MIPPWILLARDKTAELHDKNASARGSSRLEHAARIVHETREALEPFEEDEPAAMRDFVAALEAAFRPVG